MSRAGLWAGLILCSIADSWKEKIILAPSPPAPTRSPQRVSHADHTAAYNRLRLEVTAAGILERSLSFYLPLILGAFAAYAISAGAIVFLDDYLLLTFACLGFSASTVQIAGLMHDAGHRAVFRSTRLNNLLGLATTAAIGMVFPSWVHRHNLHHAHPNQAELDPDMEIPFLVLDQAEFAAKDRLQRFLSRWQAYYYYPLGALVGFSNRLGSFSYFWRHRSAWDLVRLLLFVQAVVVLFAGPFLAFPLEKAVFVFLVVHITTGVYLATCFAPNHKGMPSLARDADVSFLEQQITTARNVRGGLLTDFFLVGLNRQVEHHLFPACPRSKLVRLQPYVQDLCREIGLPYTEVGLIRTNSILVRHLHGVARGLPPVVAT